MLSNIKHHLEVYKGFISTSISMHTSFRVSFILLIFMDLFFYFSALMSVEFIYNHVENIGPWNREQLLFFISFMLAVDHLHMTLLSESFWMLGREIKTGGLDFILLKPISSIFSVFFRYFRPSSLINIFVVWGCLIYYGIEINLQTSQWILLLPLVLMAFSLMAILEFIISTSMFWLTEGLGINFLRMQLQQLARWPNFIYSSVSRKVLSTAIPILLVGSAPVHFLFDYKNWYYMVYLFLAIILSFLFLRWFWSLGLKRYDSASS